MPLCAAATAAPHASPMAAADADGGAGGPLDPGGPSGAAPVYYSDLVVRRGWTRGLRGSRLAYNDVTSLSGYECVRMWLLRGRRAAAGPVAPFFAAAVPTGGHHRSLLAVLDGRADCAAIDRCVLAKLLRGGGGGGADGGLARRVRDELDAVRAVTLGPNPSQPVCVSTSMCPRLRESLLRGFLRLDAALIGAFGLERFARVEPAFYERIGLHLRESRGVHLLTAPGRGGREELEERDGRCS